MKANELRVGNLVYFNGTSENIDLDSFHGMATFDCLDLYKPIPLTEEWFERFGFEKHQWRNEVWFTIYDLAIEKTDGGFYDRQTGTKFDSVHWLQNYVFFKTGQELTLK